MAKMVDFRVWTFFYNKKQELKKMHRLLWQNIPKWADWILCSNNIIKTESLSTASCWPQVQQRVFGNPDPIILLWQAQWKENLFFQTLYTKAHEWSLIGEVWVTHPSLDHVSRGVKSLEGPGPGYVATLGTGKGMTPTLNNPDWVGRMAPMTQ